jgi:hypothetical protein
MPPLGRTALWPNQTARLSTTPTTAAVTPVIAGHGLDEGYAGEDEEETGQERDVGGDQCPENSSGQRRKIAKQVPESQQARELGYHDQRARGGFRQSKADEHLLSAEPTLAHRETSDVTQHSVGPADADEAQLGLEFVCFLEGDQIR